MSEAPSFPRLDRIRADDGRGGFRSSSAALDLFFSKHAFDNDTRGIGRTYVLRGDPGDKSSPMVLGFFTVSMATATSDDLSQVEVHKLPRYPMPVALIGRLATDERVRGKRHGERLLIEALRLILSAADSIGCLGIIVDAKDERAAGFYEKYGFTVLAGQAAFPRRMYMPIETARASVV